MNILQLGKFYPPHIGGIETVMYDITELLVKRGYKVDVLCSNKENIYKEDIAKNYKIFRTKTLGIKFSTSISPQMIFKLRSIISKYDIIHIHMPDPMANLALFFSDTKNKKIIIHWHSDIIKQKKLLKLYEPLQNWLMKKADKIITTTPKYIEESKYLQKYKNKCVPIPIGIEKEKLAVDDKFLEQLRLKYKNKKIIFSLGRLAYYKGFEYLIKSAQYLNEEYIILIGGSGELKNKLQDEIIKNGLEKKVSLVGKIKYEHLGTYYQLCDIFCLPSIAKSEAFGIVQIEAMSFAKPIVATKIKGSGVDWVNKNEVSGINVEPKNPKKLAETFKDILTDNEIYVQYSQGAKERFLRMFNRDTMVDKIIEVYEKLQ